VTVGREVGGFEGAGEGAFETVGALEIVGCAVGVNVGRVVSLFVGRNVGEKVGETVGRSVGGGVAVVGVPVGLVVVACPCTTVPNESSMETKRDCMTIPPTLRLFQGLFGRKALSETVPCPASEAIR